MSHLRRALVPAAIAAIASLSTLLATQAFSVQSADAPPPNSPAMLKAEEAHDMMNGMAGVWDMKGQTFSPAGQPELTLSGRCVWQWAMNGAFLMGETLLSNGAGVMQEIDCLGFNSAGGTFQRTLLTDRDSAMIWQQGAWDASSKRFTMQSVGSIPTAQGGKRQVATVVDLGRSDAMGWTTTYFENGAIVGTIRITCTRAQPGESEADVIPGMPGTPMQVPTTPSGGLDPNAMQGQLNQMVANKQRLQGQIEDWKKRVKASQDSFQQLSQP